MTSAPPPLFCEACESEYRAGPVCPACGTETCARCGWCDECAAQTVTFGGLPGCGHEYVLGGIAYSCELEAGHPVDGYGPAFRHAARIDEQHAKGTGDEASDGPATLVTWGEDSQGEGQDWAIAWGAIASYGKNGAAT